MDKLTDPSVEEETKIEDIARNLYARIIKETDKLLLLQLQEGWELNFTDSFNENCPLYFRPAGEFAYDEINATTGITKTLYPDDPLALASYEYDGVKILGVRISDSRMGIEFDIPELKTRTQKEVSDVQ